MNPPVVTGYYQYYTPTHQSFKVYGKQYTGGEGCEVKGRWVGGLGKGTIFQMAEERVYWCD